MKDHNDRNTSCVRGSNEDIHRGRQLCIFGSLIVPAVASIDHILSKIKGEVAYTY